MNRRFVWPALAMLGASSWGCSLTGLDNFELPVCRSDDDCAEINRRNGLSDSACERYVCEERTRSCQRRVRQSEVCDGIDNNCDGVVDEGVLAIVDNSKQTLAMGAFSSASVAASGAGVVGIAGPPDMRISQAPVFMSTSETGVANAAATLQMRTTVRPAMSAAAWNTWPSTPRCSNASNTLADECTVSEAALAPTSSMDEWFAVAIDPLQCAAGRIRIGLVSTREGAPIFDASGPIARSNVFSVVDLDAATQCSGASRGASGARGAARPAIAQSTSARDTALAAWIGAPLDRARCGGAPATVEALGLSIETSAMRRGVFASNAMTAEPAPAVLGRTSGGGAPAIVALPTGGWLVAFGDESGAVAVRKVDALAAVPAWSAAMPDAARPTVPLSVGAPLLLQRASMSASADHVSMALRVVGSRTLVAVSWVEGCGSAMGSVQFAQLELENGALMEKGRAELARGVDAASTSVVPLDDRVLDRSNNAAQGGDRGGWLLSFEAAGALNAIRVSSATTTTVDRAAVVLASPITSARRAPLLSASATAPASVSWHSDPEQIVRYANVCGWNPTKPRAR